MPSSPNHVTLVRSSKAADSSPRKLTLLVLLADTPVEAVKKQHGDYHDVFASLFQRSLDTISEPDYELEVVSYDVVNEPWEYPTEEELSGAAGLLITGSAASAYERLPWIDRLVEFTASLTTSYPKLKLIGICYGHQIIARAFGGTVEKNVKGWELGVRTVQLSDIGKKVLLSNTGDKERDTMTIHQVHQDHVPALPDNFACLASTSVCAIQGMVRPTSPDSVQDIQIFTLQGHPEFSPDIVTEIINVREAKGVLTKDFADESRRNAALHDEGVSLGATILRIVSA